VLHLQGSTPTPILSAVLPIASDAETERSTSAARPPTMVTPASAKAGAQQLRLPAEALQSAGGALPRGLDALEALLAALADETSSALTWPPPSTARRMA
jgi:hypothetical protein